jgi:hypothetical protein
MTLNAGWQQARTQEKEIKGYFAESGHTGPQESKVGWFTFHLQQGQALKSFQINILSQFGIHFKGAGGRYYTVSIVKKAKNKLEGKIPLWLKNGLKN